YVQMYTYLLLLSSLFSFKAFTDDDAILAQSAAASAVGAVYVLFHPRRHGGNSGKNPDPVMLQFSSPAIPGRS
ncbi:hypothetical protein JTM21_37080, partial [Pseudomonas aeruginosa]|nr:hypothetical protein [Pseudomonas aeruginosa]